MSRKGNGFRLEFVGLNEGKHTFSYSLGKDFMDLFPGTEAFSDLDVHVSAELEKHERMMSLLFRFSGTAGTRCDRCLRPLRYDVDVEEEIIVKTVSEGDSGALDEENLWWISEKETFLDLASYFYETVVLSRPMQVFCPQDGNGNPTCDPAMLDLCGLHALDRETGTETDPRWDALKKLKEGI